MSLPSSTPNAAELLARLVSCPSVNPGRRTPTGPPYGEESLAQLLASILTGWGAKAEVRHVAPGRPNVVARFDGRDPSRALMLEVHSDTVGAEDMEVEPFAAAVKDGRLYGRGACDDKGPMTAMLLAIRRMLDRGEPFPVNLFFVSTCDEELGSGGAKALMEEGFRADAAVVGEPTDLRVIHAHKGALRWRILTKGLAVHSSVPDRGVNAIYQMRRVVDVIENGLAPSLHGRRHPLLGEATVSVGTIRGGTQPNVVPAECEIEVDRRLLPGEREEDATSELRRRLDDLARGDPRFHFTIEETQHFPPFEQDREAPVARLTADACRKVLGEATLEMAPWASNAGTFREAGVPSVLFGPGSIRQAHTAMEYIELNELEKAALVYEEIIRQSGNYLEKKR